MNEHDPQSVSLICCPDKLSPNTYLIITLPATSSAKHNEAFIPHSCRDWRTA